jgi:alkylation response protein AidB-like acyl-CoA dehydrogenase
MDVIVPAIPDSYADYRAALRAFLAEHKPTLEWKQRTGVRVPDLASDVEKLRSYARAVWDAGYETDRFRTERGDPFEQRILEQELARAGVPFVLGNPLVAGAFKHFGTDEQRVTYLPPMARGEHIWTQLFSEPDAGSDLTGLQTRGTRDGDSYVVSGQKVWSTWAQWADYGYLLARTEPVQGAGGITAFILDMRSAGVDVRPLREMTGTVDFNEVFFDEVRIPAVNVIGAPGEGWRVAGASLVEERSGVGGGGGGGDPVHLLRAPAPGIAHRPGPNPAPPGPTHGHQGGPGADLGGGRPHFEDLVQRAEPGDRRDRVGPAGGPFHAG